MPKYLFAFALALALPLHSEVRLPHVLGDNMVIQQDTDVRLWGWAKAGSEVIVKASWLNATASCQAGGDGRFQTIIKTPKASYQPLDISFSDGDGQTTILHNILAGEVWVCAGQSNMEMPVKGFPMCPVEDYNDVVADATRHAAIRAVKIPARMSATPLDDAQCQWQITTPQTVGDISATGYFFARQLEDALHVPVGLIEANKGGSRLESWLTKENLQKYTTDPTDSVEIAHKWSKWDFHRSMLWGNATFNPILRCTVKGILYYQGCSNVGDPAGQYSQRMKLLVEQWRRQFGLGEIPFYFVQIAPYRYSDDPNATAGARLREEQWKAAQIIPNSYLIATGDLVYPYEGAQIHPTQKRQVGQRLAYTALARDYGMTGLWYRCSTFKEMKIDGDKVLLHFADNYGSDAPFEGAEGFEIAGEDHVFHRATATHYWQEGPGPWNEALLLTSPEVTKPVAVRYCFRDFQIGTYKNGGGMPLYPFRTDDWGN